MASSLTPGNNHQFMEAKGEQTGVLSLKSPRTGQSPAVISFRPKNNLDVPVLTIIVLQKSQSSNVIVLNKYVN